MTKAAKLRTLGAVGLLFNFWLIGKYNLSGLPVLLLTIGYAVAFELLVVRGALSPNPDQDNIASGTDSAISPDMRRQAPSQERAGTTAFLGRFALYGVWSVVFAAVFGVTKIALDVSRNGMINWIQLNISQEPRTVALLVAAVYAVLLGLVGYFGFSGYSVIRRKLGAASSSVSASGMKPDCRNQSSESPKPASDDIYRLVGEELSRREIHPGPRARAIAEAAGNKELAKSLYIKYRAQALVEDASQRVCIESDKSNPRQRPDSDDSTVATAETSSRKGMIGVLVAVVIALGALIAHVRNDLVDTGGRTQPTDFGTVDSSTQPLAEPVGQYDDPSISASVPFAPAKNSAPQAPTPSASVPGDESLADEFDLEMDSLRPSWRREIQSEAFSTWLSTLPAVDMQALLNSSDAEWVVAQLLAFDRWNATRERQAQLDKAFEQRPTGMKECPRNFDCIRNPKTGLYELNPAGSRIVP